MSKISRFVLGVSLALACSGMAAAQDNPQPMVLQITREYTKPGRAGMLHDQKEWAFVQAMERAKWPTHYTGMTSLTGKQRALFITEYPTFAAWEQDNAAIAKNKTLAGALDRAGQADGELLESMDQAVFVYHPEMSLRSLSTISQARFLDASVYHVRAGHTAEWNELVKLVKDAYEKGLPEAHWGAYSEAYGGAGGTYIILIARKDLGEVDYGFTSGNAKFMEALGSDGAKRLSELSALAIESSDHELFAFNPHMSYVPDEWIKSDDFWKVKSAPAKPVADDTKPKP